MHCLAQYTAPCPAHVVCMYMYMQNSFSPTQKCRQLRIPAQTTMEYMYMYIHTIINDYTIGINCPIIFYQCLPCVVLNEIYLCTQGTQL